MPADALPQPWPARLPGLVHFERSYRDILGRPLKGSVRITGQARAVHGATVVSPAPVIARLDDSGLLAVDLPAGRYELVATLHTVDATLHTVNAERVTETSTVTLGEP